MTDKQDHDARPMAKPEQQPPRLRLRDKVDFSKAKPSCGRCHGTGIHGYRTVEDHEGNTVKAPVVCRCVTRNGGVELDKLDRLLLDMNRRLADGSFGETLAADIMKIPAEARGDALRNVRAQIENPETHQVVREALTRCLDIVAEQGGAFVSAINA
jgi:hypothetical protein